MLWQRARCFDLISRRYSLPPNACRAAQQSAYSAAVTDTRILYEDSQYFALTNLTRDLIDCHAIN